MAKGDTILYRMPAGINVVYLIQSGVHLKQGHCIKVSHPLSKHAISEIVYTTKVHRRISTMKVYIVDDAAHINKCGNRI